MPKPTPQRALDGARVAREAGQLTVAGRALDHVYTNLEEHPQLRGPLAIESAVLARELALRGASLAALGLWLRAQELGKDQTRNVTRMIGNYSAWRPQLCSVGAPKEALTAGASGAFWVSIAAKARILALQGGITGDGTEPFARVLHLACEGIHWVFVDMSEVSYVGSAGLAVAVKVSEKLRQREGGLSLFGLSANLQLLVETLGLDSYLNPQAYLEGAIALGQSEEVSGR